MPLSNRARRVIDENLFTRSSSSPPSRARIWLKPVSEGTSACASNSFLKTKALPFSALSAAIIEEKTSASRTLSRPSKESKSFPICLSCPPLSSRPAPSARQRFQLHLCPCCRPPCPRSTKPAFQPSCLPLEQIPSELRFSGLPS